MADDEEDIEELRDEDEISDREEGFMKGEEESYDEDEETEDGTTEEEKLEKEKEEE